MLNKGVKSIKKVLQELKSPRKSPPAENLHYAETSQPTYKADKLTGCNKRRSKARGDLRTDQSTINTC